MTKHKHTAPKHQSVPKPEIPTARHVKSTRSASRRHRFTRKWLIGGGVLTILVMGVILVLLRSQTQTVDSTLPAAHQAGNVQNCAGFSPFIRTLGFSQNSAFDTRAKYVKGIAIRQFDQAGNIIRSYQDPSWTHAGYLGSIQQDMQGNIYLIPVPAINILDNPPIKSNIVYRINGNTGIMAPLVNLPILAPANTQNAYGLLNIAYDCETRSLYASSVYGSSYDHIAGCIFQIDPVTGDVRSSLEYVDAFGLGVFNTISGKRLYFGLARTPDIYSVALDAKGSITKDVRKEPSLMIGGTTTDERVQSIKFKGANQMIIKTTAFDFNLSAPTEVMQTLITYNYDFRGDSWQYVNSQIVSG